MASKFEAFADGLAALALERDRLAVHMTGGPVTVAVADILYIQTDGFGVRLVLADGRELEPRPMDTLPTLGARLARHPGFVRTANTHLVNLDHVASIRKVAKDLYELRLPDGRALPLAMGFGEVKAYFGLQDLEHITPWSDREAAIVREQLRTFDKDIRFMDNAEIMANFSTADGKQLVLRQLIGNMLWQVYHWIREGKEGPVDGNIRSLWYSHVKPVVRRFFDSSMDKRLYDDLINTFRDYVGTLYIFRYGDFGLVDDAASSWLVGERHPQIIVCAEKTGHWKTMQDIAAATGVTVISLGGASSLMTTEFLVDALVAKGVDPKAGLHLVTDVDYDPSGNLIAQGFINQLHQMGIDDPIVRFDIIQPQNFTSDEIKYFRVPVAQLDQASKTKTAAWLDKKKTPFGGGLPGPDGKPVADGLESDTMPRARIIDNAVAAVNAILAAPKGEPWAKTLARIESHRKPIHSIWDGYEAYW